MCSPVDKVSTVATEKHEHLKIKTSLTGRLRLGNWEKRVEKGKKKKTELGNRRSPFSSWFCCQLSHRVIHYMDLSFSFLPLCLCFPSCNRSSAFQHNICGHFIGWQDIFIYNTDSLTRKLLLLMSAQCFNYSIFLFTLVWYLYLRMTKLIKTNRTSSVERV